MRRGGAAFGAVVALVGLVVAGAPGVAGGDEPAARRVTLAEARAAVGQAPAHRAAQARTGAASEARAASGAWPVSSFGAWGTRYAEQVGFSVALPLPVFGSLAADRRVAGAELEVARAEAGGVDLGLEREVTRAWLELARAEARAERSQAAQAREHELAEATRKRFEAGDAPRAEVVAADAADRRARAEADADTAAIAAAAADLAAPLGWDPELALHAEGGLPAPGGLPPLAELRSRRTSHPDARASGARAAAEDAQVAVAHHRRLPELALDAESLFGDPGLPGTDFKLGVTLSVPLFSGTSAAERAARARRDAARVEHDATLATLDGAIVAAYRRLEAAERRAAALEKDVLPAQREAAELARAAYREGAGGLAFVLEAERALSEVELAFIDARAEAALARVELEWAVGGTL